MPEERLNRYISRAAGVSRRTADEMIRMGRVTVGGRQATDPGTLFDPGRRDVRIDGNAVVAAEDEKIYVMAYKPDSVVTTMKDKEGRKTAASLVGELSSARTFLARMLAIDPHARSSMADDLARGRPSEVDDINGEIVALARRRGRDAPVNARLVALMREAEAGGRKQWDGAQLLAQLRAASEGAA